RTHNSRARDLTALGEAKNATSGLVGNSLTRCGEERPAETANDVTDARADFESGYAHQQGEERACEVDDLGEGGRNRQQTVSQVLERLGVDNLAEQVEVLFLQLRRLVRQRLLTLLGDQLEANLTRLSDVERLLCGLEFLQEGHDAGNLAVAA